jgi:hypothetical protein
VSNVKVVSNGVDKFTAIVPQDDGYEVDWWLYRNYEDTRLAYDEALAKLERALIEASRKDN